MGDNLRTVVLRRVFHCFVIVFIHLAGTIVKLRIVKNVALTFVLLVFRPFRVSILTFTLK